MERILKDLKPENVFFFFEEISRIPRNSGDEQAVSEKAGTKGPARCSA